MVHISKLLHWAARKHFVGLFKRIPNYRSIIRYFTTDETNISKVNVEHIKSLKDIAFPSLAPKTNTVYSTLNVNKQNKIATIQLNRPKQLNAFDMTMWNEYKHIFQDISHDQDTRVAILLGSTKSFSTGMDLSVFLDIDVKLNDEKCEGRKKEGLYNIIHFFQSCVTAPETCCIPVIVGISGYCIGGALDVVTACDMRYCTKDAKFSIRETDLGMVADIGTMQRLPRIIGTQQTAELAFTGREFFGPEAEKLGLVLKCFDTEKEMIDHMQQVATSIASKSPLTIRGIKKTLLYQQDHPLGDSLDQINSHNTAMMHSDDLSMAMKAYMLKQKPSYNGH